MFELRVLNGLHQGAALPLVGDQWVIGANDEHDLALYDPGIAALHCRLSRTEEGWNLAAEQMPINDDEGRGSNAITLTPNQPFALANVWLCVAPAEEPWPDVPALATPANANGQAPQSLSPSARKSMPGVISLKLISAVIAGVVVGLVGGAWGLSQSEVPSGAVKVAPAQTPKNPTQSSPAAVPARSADSTSLKNREQIRRLLTTQLAERLLTEVTVEELDEGLVLKGNLKEEALEVYQRMLQSFKERYPTTVPLIDHVGIVGTNLPFTLVQIIAGNNAHLVTADGLQIYVGDVVQGLRLVRIEEHKIIFDGDQHIEVSW
ncbi:FHA domain-containing protein [Pseudomonas sp. D1-1]|uniref:FHA domain-containing protein n=1 Tax=Pseudomonas sp. D1-1 TaxID=1040793 RepID=UPI003DA818B3